MVSPEAPVYRSRGAHTRWKHFTVPVFFIFVNILLFVLWAALVLNDLRFVHEYTSLGPAVGSTFFHSSRYDWIWWMVWLAGLNVLLPYLLIWSLVNNHISQWASFHQFVSGVAIIVNLGLIAVFFVIWIWFCNWATSPGSPCNSLKWCCLYYASTNLEWCQNGMPCPSMPSLDLDPIFLAAWCCLGVATLFAFANYRMNQYGWKVGVFVEKKAKDDEGDEDEE